MPSRTSKEAKALTQIEETERWHSQINVWNPDFTGTEKDEKIFLGPSIPTPTGY